MTNTMGTTTDARPTPDLMLWLEIFETQSRYAHAIDSDDLETWPAFFTEDATYTIVSRENHDRGLPAPILHCRNRAMMRDRVVALRNANIYEEHRYRHSTSGPVILEADGDSVRTETSYIVVRTGQAGGRRGLLRRQLPRHAGPDRCRLALPGTEGHLRHLPGPHAARHPPDLSDAMATWFGVIRLEALIAEEPIPVEAGGHSDRARPRERHRPCAPRSLPPPRRGPPLSEGFFEGGGLLECVLHQCRYALATGGAIRPSGVGVRAYPTRIVGGMVQVGITGGNPSDT